MSRGHGTPGLVDFLRPFSELVDDVNADRRPILEFSPGSELLPAKWAPHSTAYAYVVPIQYTLDGAAMPIVGVQMEEGTALTRAESLAECIATAGTFYSDAGAAATVPFWDDGVTLWDSGETWDQTGSRDLYVRLADDTDPDLQSGVALIGFRFAAKGETHPHLGDDKLTNGGFETDFTGWTESVSGAGWSSAIDTVLYTERGSTSSLKLVSTGAATGEVNRYQQITTQTAGLYRLSFAYRTDLTFSANLTARVMVGNTANTVILYSDGRDADASGGATLKPTVGEWRRATFDFLAPDTTTRVRFQLIGSTSAGAGQFNVDNAKAQCIFGFHYYNPRLSIDSLPEVEVAAQSIFFGGKTVGLGAFSLMNADGPLDALFGQLLLHNRPATVYVGGAFQDGQEIYREDWRAGWPGLAQRVDADQVAVHVQTEDARNRVHVMLPLRAYEQSEFADLAKADIGKPRPFGFGLLGAAGNDGTPIGSVIPVARVGLTSNGYGVYEVFDAATALSDFPANPEIYIWPNEDEARKVTDVFIGDGATRPRMVARATVDSQQQVSIDLTTMQFTVLDDLRDYRLDPDGKDLGPIVLDFNIGGGALAVSVDKSDFATNNYTWGAKAVARDVGDAMTTAAGATITCTYDHSTHKFTISKATGTLNLLAQTGASVHAGGYARLGFAVNADKTGALTYTSDEPTFNDVDRQHILRVVTFGPEDDASGTFTGTPGAGVPFASHGAIARYILQAFLKIPASKIDAASFRDVDSYEFTGANSPGVTHRVAVWLGGEFESSAEVLARLEEGALADLVIDGDGKWFFQSSRTTKPVMRDFYDRDYVTPPVFTLDPENIYPEVRVFFRRHVSEDRWPVVSAIEDSAIRTKHGREPVKDVYTYLDSVDADGEDNASASGMAGILAARLARLAAANPLTVTFQSRGKLADLLVGDKIRLTCSRALTSTGSLDAVQFRIKALRHNHLSGVSTCTAVQDVTFLS